MAIDREATLKNAEKFLRVGRLDAAIAEYVRLVEDQPRDWNTANALGDLYVRGAQPGKAVTLYRMIAEHFLAQGFYPKAAALLKKALKITPDDEQAQMRLAEISARQGLMADARSYYTTIANRRRHRGDAAGADEIVVRLGALDPSDVDARLEGARASERGGHLAAAAQQYRELYDAFIEHERPDEAVAALRDCVRCDPEAKGSDVLLPLATVELENGRLDSAQAMLAPLLASGDAGARDAIIDLAWRLMSTNPGAAGLCIDTAADALVAAGEWADAAALLQELATRTPGRVPALLRLVEVCVDGGLEATMYEAQAQLADAYLDAGKPAEARVIAEDLVTHDRSEQAHVNRLRRALEMLDVEDVDGVVAAVVAAAPSSFTSATASHELAAAKDAPVQAGPPAHVVEIDLTSLLIDLQFETAEPESPASAAQPQDLEEVFAGIRSAASRESADVAGDHIALARSYLDIGVPGEAITSLEVAVRSAEHQFVAASMLGRIYRDSGDLDRAVEWFERAAAASAPEAEEGPALLYDLGDVLERARETGRALAVFLELHAEAPGYRDVGERVSRLSKIETEG